MKRLLVCHATSDHSFRGSNINQPLKRGTCEAEIRGLRVILREFAGDIVLQGFSPAVRAHCTWFPATIGLFNDVPAVEIPELFPPQDGNCPITDICGQAWREANKNLNRWPTYSDSYHPLLDELGSRAAHEIKKAENDSGTDQEGASLWVFHRPLIQAVARHFISTEWGPGGIRVALQQLANLRLSECQMILLGGREPFEVI